MASLELAAGAMGAGQYVPHLVVAAAEYGISTPLRQAHWLGQLFVESGGFTRTRESLDYAADRLLAMFPKRITVAEAKQYGRIDAKNQSLFPAIPPHPADQRSIANIIYGGKWGFDNLGNTQPNDGWHFRGVSLKQLTGRSNINRCSLALFGDQRATVDPTILEKPEYAARAGGWFWKVNNINEVADRDDVRAVTRVVNGGTNGLVERIKQTKRAKALLGIT